MKPLHVAAMKEFMKLQASKAGRAVEAIIAVVGLSAVLALVGCDRVGQAVTEVRNKIEETRAKPDFEAETIREEDLLNPSQDGRLCTGFNLEKLFPISQREGWTKLPLRASKWFARIPNTADPNALYLYIKMDDMFAKLEPDYLDPGQSGIFTTRISRWRIHATPEVRALLPASESLPWQDMDFVRLRVSKHEDGRLTYVLDGFGSVKGRLPFGENAGWTDLEKPTEAELKALGFLK